VKEFNPKEPVQFRHAPEQVRVVATDLKDDRPIVIAVTIAGKETIGYRHADGRVISNRESPYDLVNVPKKHEVWINMYDTEGVLVGCAYHTHEQANAKANIDRIACIRVEFTEGEGL
jgi:hypothetical protein